MYKKTISYVDFNGNERSDEILFNLTKAEIAEWELKTEGGLETLIQRIISTKDSKKLIEIFQDIIDKSYGVLSADGKYFRKSLEALADFKSTQAYSDFYMELVTDANKAAEFINGITPSDAPKGHLDENGNVVWDKNMPKDPVSVQSITSKPV